MNPAAFSSKPTAPTKMSKKSKENPIEIEEQKIESIIRYWILLEELKRQKANIFDQTTSEEKSSDMRLWRFPKL